MKKLKLNREILYGLNDDELKKVKGGDDFTFNLVCYSYFVCSYGCGGGGGSNQCGTNPYCGSLNNCGTGQVYCTTEDCYLQTNANIC